ncbi:hypothetical protein [Streptomyces sp. NPDC005435]|uniref:hypothetical protein n=1 Tax=Streptomyces sp. NPDC005435 TaxID=3154464 RepID=UPI00387E420C
MPNSSNPQRLIDRRVYLLLLDEQDRLMLCGGCCNGWTIPQLLLAPGTDFRDGAAHYLTQWLHITNPRFGSVYGVLESQDLNRWEHDRHTISHVFIMRISSDESDSIQATSRTHARWGLYELKSRYREGSPEGVVPLASGYVEGGFHDVLGDLLVSASPGEDEITQAGDAEHDVVNYLSLQAEVAKNIPGLDPGEGMLDADSDLAVGGIVFPLSDEECGRLNLPRVRAR